MRKFHATASRGEQKYAGTFRALDIREARKKLESQGYRIDRLEELASYEIWIMLGILAIIFMVALCFFVLRSRKDAKEAVTVTTTIERGSVATLKGGDYLISTSDKTLVRARALRASGMLEDFKKILRAQQVGTTQNLGAGQKVEVLERRWDDKIAAIRFRNGSDVCWVEDEALS